VNGDLMQYKIRINVTVIMTLKSEIDYLLKIEWVVTVVEKKGN
jgi:hypothetical protein